MSGNRGAELIDMGPGCAGKEHFRGVGCGLLGVSDLMNDM
jgi:hypothetical protein